MLNQTITAAFIIIINNDNNNNTINIRYNMDRKWVEFGWSISERYMELGRDWNQFYSSLLFFLR